MDNTKLIRLRDVNGTLTEKIHRAIVLPEIYIAPTIKSILDERDTVPKTKWRILNPGRRYNGSVLLFLPEAHFRWQEPVTNGREYGELLEVTMETYSLKVAQVKQYAKETGDWV